METSNEQDPIINPSSWRDISRKSLKYCTSAPARTRYVHAHGYVYARMYALTHSRTIHRMFPDGDRTATKPIMAINMPKNHARARTPVTANKLRLVIDLECKIAEATPAL